ncbi:glycerophosphodiester phosphodiesterase [Neptunitalea lumnitzerae]|nr:glycerophosphodiester phosphodiesterase family protein [Neptunitalea sp. Y10]
MVSAQEKPLVIGHRGAMGYATENTLASIQKALDFSVDAIEIDVYKIKSGELVVFHDNNVQRLTGTDSTIEDFTFEELQKLTVKGGHKIPTLQQVMDLIGTKCRLNIELKGANTAKDSYQVVIDYIANKGWTKEQVIFSSFRWDELQKVYDLDSTMPLAVLTEKDPLLALEVAGKLHAEAINPHYKSLTKDTVAKIHEKGFKIYTWTVNSKQYIAYMKMLGVDGIITNYPDRVQ